MQKFRRCSKLGETSVRINLLGSGFIQEGTLGPQATTNNLKINNTKEQQPDFTRDL
jgi:hypothetical protein